MALSLSLRFEPAMAAAGMVALLHDLLLTVGVYALAGMVVTPATVIALLTVLGSLYDTVIVFDRVRELDHDRAPGTSHADAADAALNQTVARSLTTSVIALLPVTGLLPAGSIVLGAEVLQDLALAQFVGIAVGACSSLFIATPVLVQLEQRQERRAGSHRGDRSASPAHVGRPA